MWLLVTCTGKLIYLKSNVSVSIGRKKTDILLSHDASVSKLHASIVVKLHSSVMVGKPTSSCILKDEGSKYGTYISRNGTFEKVIANIYLKDQDVIRIGLQKEIFTVKYIPMISMTSALQDNEKEKLLEIMNEIDGIITTDWNQSCTHLTVIKPKLTQKVAVSLAACIPIVSIDYWDAVKSIMEKGEPLPETDKFVPKINEQYISKISTSLSPNYERNSLFTDLIFNFFSTKQYEVYKTMIQLAGGKSVLFNPNNEKNNTFDHNFIFVHYSVTDTTQQVEDFAQGYDYICKKLDTCKLRVIPESEIPLAILHCSIEQYCNTKFNFGNCLKRQEKPNYNLPETLVVDTQDQDILIVKDLTEKQKSSYNKHTHYVAETLESDGGTSMQDDAMLQESLHSSEKLTSQGERSACKKLIVPETIDSSDSSQRNTDCHTKQDLNYDPFKANIDNNLKETHSSISATYGEKHIATLSDEYNNDQVDTSYAKKISSSEIQICIPETIDDNYSNCYENSNKVSKVIDSSVTNNNFFKENDSNDVTIKKEISKVDKDMLITTQNVPKAEVTKNIQSHKIKTEVEKDKTWISTFPSNIKLLKEIDNEDNSATSYRQIRKNPLGKTFKKAYVIIPEKRKRLMDLAEEN